MSDTDFRISKKVVVTALLGLIGCIAGLVVYIYQQDKAYYKEDKKVILDAIKISVDGIQATTQVQQHLLREVVRLDGADATHAAKQQAHHKPVAIVKPPAPDGG